MMMMMKNAPACARATMLAVATLALVMILATTSVHCSQPNKCSQAPFNTYPYCDPNLPIAERVSDLVARMNTTEKIQNMQNVNPGIPRLGVPPLQFSECLHGVLSGCGAATNGSTGCPTSFPSGLGLGATFNQSLWLSVGQTISTEARALNNQNVSGIMYWAPDINLFRDPRWGRGQEVPGEDPWLTSRYVAHYSQGLQQGIDPRYLKVVSTCKHFLAYDLENWGGVDRFHFDAQVPMKYMTEYYLPVFRSCVEEAEVNSIMCSYNAENGVPSCANGLYMTTVAREEWGFGGFFVSDCGAISDIYDGHNYTATPADTCEVAVRAGCDLECGGFYSTWLNDTLAKGQLNVTDLDIAISRVYYHFIRLGALDPPEDQPYLQLGPSDVDTTEHRAMALDAAHQAIVLLKNDNNVLPIDLSTTKTIAIVGPNANATQTMLSNYFGTNTLVNSNSPYQALQDRAASFGINVIYEQGCDINSKNTSRIPLASAAAAKADIAILVLGLDGTIEAEGLDRINISLPGEQDALAQAVFQAQPNTVVVLINGGPVAIDWIADNMPCIVEAFYPGELGGPAIVDVLLGDVNPGGKLPYTIYPADFIQRSMFDMDLASNGGVTYLYYEGEPLFEFGHGLSYTNFTYAWVNDTNPLTRTSKTAVRHVHTSHFDGESVWEGVLDYVVNVTNTGLLSGDAVVLGFITNSTTTECEDLEGTDQPIRELFGFDRVFLEPGEHKLVFLSVPPQVLGTVDSDGVHAVRVGQRHSVQIGVGGDAISGGSIVVDGERDAILHTPPVELETPPLN